MAHGTERNGTERKNESTERYDTTRHDTGPDRRATSKPTRTGRTQKKGRGEHEGGGGGRGTKRRFRGDLRRDGGGYYQHQYNQQKSVLPFLVFGLSLVNQEPTDPITNTNKDTLPLTRTERAVRAHQLNPCALSNQLNQR